jgi:phage head maturation protease
MVEGWVVYWNTLRHDRRTRIACGAFDADLREEGAVLILLDHDPTLELGIVRALGLGPYNVRSFPRGLRFLLQLEAGPWLMCSNERCDVDR